MKTARLFIVAGEASADLHAASLVRELKTIRDIECFGVGGERLTAAGMEVLVPASQLNILGFVDWWDSLGSIWKSLKTLERTIAERRPDLILLLDLPDFNLTLARRIKKLGIPIVYYISPQVWAWRKYRVHQIRRLVDKMLVLFPFEKDFYAQHGVDAEFVGHPLLDQIEPRYLFRSQPEINSAPRVALLPGSRPKELHNHADLLRETARRIRQKFPNASFKVPIASTLTPTCVRGAFGDVEVECTSDATLPILNWADYACVASGTATLETALVGTPLCIYYKVSPLNAFIKDHIFRYRGFFGMPNLLLGEAAVPEFFQEGATAEALSNHACRVFEDETYRTMMVERLQRCRTLLGAKGASRRVALEVARVLSRERAPLQKIQHALSPA